MELIMTIERESAVHSLEVHTSGESVQRSVVLRSCSHPTPQTHHLQDSIHCTMSPAFAVSDETPLIALVTSATANDNPNDRTLWDIVRGCIFTIFLCAWVSVHPNIPGPDEKWTKVTRRRIGIMVAVLVTPELVLMWAVRQKVYAYKLEKKFKSM
jgi:hypothetical protein